MAEDATLADAESISQAASDAQAQAAETQQPAVETISLDEAKKLRSEAQSLRKRLKAFEDAEQQRKTESLSEAEKSAAQLKSLQETAAKAENDRAALRLQLAVERAARKLNITDEDAAFKLMDASAVEYDDNGVPTNVDAVLAALTKARPWLVQKTQPVASSGATANPARSEKGVSRETLSKMSPREVADMFEKDPAAVMAAMKGN